MSELSRQELRAAGQAVLDQLRHGSEPPHDRPLALGSVPGLGHYTNEALWGSVWTRRALDLQTRVLITLAVLTTLQRLAQLRTYLHSALNVGIERRTIEEVLVQCSVQAGFPSTVNALELFREVMERRGLDFGEPGDAPVEEEPTAAELAVRGAELRGRLFDETGSPEGEEDSPAAVLRRVADRYVFGDVYQRPGLGLDVRVACTVAALVALGDREQLARWLRAGTRVGLSQGQLGEVVLQAAYYAGFPAADRAMAVVSDVFSPGG